MVPSGRTNPVERSIPFAPGSNSPTSSGARGNASLTVPTFPDPNDPWALVSFVNVGKDELKRAKRSKEAQQATIAGEGTVLPIVYGADLLGARIAGLVVYQGDLVLLAVWCHGEIDAIEALYVNGEVPGAGISATHYTGTSGQAADPTLVAAYAAQGKVYTDTLAGIAYSVVRVQRSKNSGFARLMAKVRGLKIRSTEFGSRAYSDNPALVLADFIESTTYGMGRSVDWNTVATVAAACDATIGSPAEKKRTVSLSIDAVQTCEEWVNVLRDYAGCWVVPEGESYRLVADAPGSSVMSFDENNIVENSLKCAKRGTLTMPTVIEVVYTDISTIPWRDNTVTITAPGVNAGTLPRRVARLQKPGITRYSEAYRWGVERLNDGLLNDLSVVFTAFDDALEVVIGDIIDVTHPIGLAAKLVRVMKITPVEPGRWQISAVEYDPAKYSSDVVTGPTTPDTSLPSVSNPPAPTGLTVAEEIYQVQTGLYASRLRGSWVSPASTYPFVNGFRVEVSQGGAVVDGPYFVPAGVTSYVTGPLEENLTYTFSVATISVSGATGAASTQSVTTNGKTARPSDVPYLFAYEAAGETRFEWSSAFDEDLRAHELRYGPRVSATWASATLIDRVPHPARRYVTRSIPPGDWRFFAKGLDSVRSATYPYGQESLNAKTFDLVVGGDPELFLAAVHDFTTPTLANMVEERVLGAVQWVSDYGGLWNAVYTSNLDTYTNPLVTYSGTGTSSLVTEAYDLGQSYSGLFLGTIQWTDVSGTAQPYVEVSPDEASWTRYPGLSAQAVGRYVRIGVETTGIVIVTALGSVSVSVATLSETGVVTTSASAPVTVPLARTYTRVKTIQLTADVAAGQANPGYLNVVISSDPAYVDADYVDDEYVDQNYAPVNSFDVQCWDGSNNLIAREVRYVFSGI